MMVLPVICSIVKRKVFKAFPFSESTQNSLLSVGGSDRLESSLTAVVLRARRLLFQASARISLSVLQFYAK